MKSTLGTRLLCGVVTYTYSRPPVDQSWCQGLGDMEVPPPPAGPVDDGGIHYTHWTGEDFTD